MKGTEDSLRDLWDNIKHTNIRIIGIPEEEREKGEENLFKGIIAENFPDFRRYSHPDTKSSKDHK